jgi:hypothetical protein
LEAQRQVEEVVHPTRTYSKRRMLLVSDRVDYPVFLIKLPLLQRRSFFLV